MEDSMFLLRRVITVLCMTCILAGNAFSEENEAHLQKRLGIGLRPGVHNFVDSDLTDFWKFDPKKNDFMAEMSFEYKLFQPVGIEFAIGRTSMVSTVYSTLEASDQAILDINSYYLSPSIKLYRKLTSRLLIFGGIGPDLYRTKGTFIYTPSGSSQYRLGSSKLVYGMHGLLGLEYFFSTNPGASGSYNWPVSVELQYRYATALLDEADKVLIDQINEDQSTTYGNHELDVGGHSITIGLKWHLF